MGIWNELKNLGEEYVARLPELYASRNFPYEVRGLFSDWFEQQNWNFDEKNPENLPYSNELLSGLMKKLEEFCSKHNDDLMSQMRNQSLKKQFYDAFSGKPQYFVATVRDILTEEKHLLAAKSMNNMDLNSTNQFSNDCDMSEPEYVYEKVTIAPSLEELNAKVVEIDTYIKEYRNTQEDFVIQYQNVLKIDSEIQSLSISPKNNHRDQQIQQLMRKKQDVEQTVKGKAEYLLQERMVVMNHLFNIQRIISNISMRIMEELMGWRACYQKSLSGAPKPEPLDEIQTWFESLTDILWHFYSLASQYKFLFDTLPIRSPHSDDKEKIDKLVKDIVTNLTQLIMRSFVVDKQPPQVMKTQTKFQASVRLLVGSKLNLQMNCPEVTVSILSEKQCKELVQGKSLAEVGTCGQILNDKCMMEHNKGSNNERAVLQADFKNLQLKNIQRKDRKGQESVLEAKSALVFSAELKISGGESLPVMEMSVPVVVVVHGNQIPNSEATIVWDNMFSHPGREPFITPDSVSWQEMSIALNSRWMLSNETQLHGGHLNFLQDKIRSTLGDMKSDTPHDTKIPWSSFNKEAVVKGKNFTFWEWFYGAIEVVKKNLKDHWKYNSLEFCTKEMCKIKLLEKPPGTFMIRFSESDFGAVSIAWCEERNGLKEVMNLQPWNSKDFSIRNLADRIFDLPDLTHLFPDIVKEMAFGEFRTIEVANTVNAGYVDTGIIARILPAPSSDQKSEIKKSPSPRMEFSAEYPANNSLSPFSDPFTDPEILGPATIQTSIQRDDFQKMLADVTQWTGCSLNMSQTSPLNTPMNNNIN